MLQPGRVHRRVRRSALGQSVPCRVFVADDGSSDRGPDVAEKLGVEVFRLPHRGAVATFRAGVELVATPFYCLLNADDALDSAFVERTRPVLDDPGSVRLHRRRPDRRVDGNRSARPFDRGALRWGNYVHAASLTRTAAYRAVGGFDSALRTTWRIGRSGSPSWPKAGSGWPSTSPSSDTISTRRTAGTKRAAAKSSGLASDRASPPPLLRAGGIAAPGGIGREARDHRSLGVGATYLVVCRRVDWAGSHPDALP